MKTIVKVFIGRDEEYKGTLNGCIKEARKLNKQYGECAVIEIWAIDDESDYYVSTLDNFWR